jgi:hypothetical protein
VTFLAYLDIWCSRFISGHPKWRYTEKVVKIKFRLISHQMKDFLYLNFPNMDFESESEGRTDAIYKPSLEIVLCTRLLKLCGGKDVVTFYCTDIDLHRAIGSPPFICLLPCNNQRVTKNRLSIVMWGPSIRLGVKIAILMHLLICNK